MASERSTDVQAFIGELDGGVFETKIGAVLSEVASGVMNTKTKGKVSLNLEKQSFVVIHILPRMGPLVQLHLVLGQVKLNMYLLLKHFGKLNLKI